MFSKIVFATSLFLNGSIYLNLSLTITDLKYYTFYTILFYS